MANPLAYYDNNVAGTLSLLQAMAACDVKTLVSSSSATVYGNPQRLPLAEDYPLASTNPYGQTKLVIETMLRDLHRSDATWRISILRYFNPVGAHASGLNSTPNAAPSTWAPAWATACCRWCAPSSRPAAGPCPAAWGRAAAVTLPPVMPMRLWPWPCWACAPSATCLPCVPMPGAGRAATRTGTKNMVLGGGFWLRGAGRRRGCGDYGGVSSQ